MDIIDLLMCFKGFGQWGDQRGNNSLKTLKLDIAQIVSRISIHQYFTLTSILKNIIKYQQIYI